MEEPLLIEKVLAEDGHRKCKPCSWATMRRRRMGWGDSDIVAMADFYAKRLSEVGGGWTPSMG